MIFLRVFPFLILFLVVSHAGEIPKMGMYSEKPAEKWQEALITGNGQMGALVFGDPYNERIILNHEKLYEPLRDEVVKAPSIGRHLPAVRELISEGDFKAANELFYQKMKEEGYPGILWTDPYHPAYSIGITSQPAGEVKDYMRSTNFQTGEIKVSWSDDNGSYERGTFVSRADNLIVQEIRSLSGKPLSLELSLSGKELKNIGSKQVQKGQGGFGEPEIRVTETELHFKLAYSKTQRGYQGLTQVQTDGKSSVDGTLLKISGAEFVILVSRIEPSEDITKSVALGVVPEIDYETSLLKHVALHRAMFDRLSIDLGGTEHHLSTEALLEKQLKRPEGDLNITLLEKMFQMGIYSIISSNGKYPPNLMGIWNGEARPMWSGDFTLDSNINLQTSAINLANLPECVDSYWSLIEELLPSWRENAMNYYGCRGVMAGSRTSGRENNQVHHSKGFPGGVWTASAQWLAAPFIEYVQVTGDEVFLREKLLPLLAEICLFYEDFLNTVDENGHVVFAPSMSPENSPSNTKLLFAANATMDVACATEALTTAIEYAEQLGLYSAVIPRWKALLAKMRPYLYEPDGALKEWADTRLEDREDHRHGSHFYPVYPGHFARPDLDKKLYEGSILAAEQRGRGNGSAHGLAFMAIFGARLHNPDLVYGNLDFMLRGEYILPSLFTYHNPGRIYNSDMLHSLPTAVMEMLAYSRPGVLEVLPSLPKQLKKGSITGMMTRSQCRIKSLSWDREKNEVSVILEPLKSQILRVTMPDGSIKKHSLEKGELTHISSTFVQ